MNVTRKRGRGPALMTVDSLHASFQKIDTKVRHMIEKGCTDSALNQCISRLWMQHFHHNLSKAATKGMIMHYRSLYKSRKTRKQKGQKGGMAPLDYSGGQGTTEIYGRFPVAEGSSSKFVHALGSPAGHGTFESSIGTTCTRQQGGGILDTASAFIGQNGTVASVGMGHPIQSIPSNTLQNAINAGQGRPSATNPDPTAPAWKSHVFMPKTFNTEALQKFDMSPVYKY
jgi:hypothetical protein